MVERGFGDLHVIVHVRLKYAVYQNTAPVFMQEQTRTMGMNSAGYTVSNFDVQFRDYIFCGPRY